MKQIACFLYKLSILSTLNILYNSDEGKVFCLFRMILIRFFCLIDKLNFKVVLQPPQAIMPY